MALMEQVRPPPGRPPAVIAALSGALIIGGVLLVGALAGSAPAAPPNRIALTGLGAALLFVRAAMLSTYLVVPIVRVIAWPLARLRAATLARENAIRNPARTAVTAAALSVGLALVAFVTILAAELRQSANDAVRRDFGGSFVVQNSLIGGDALPRFIAPEVRSVAGLSTVTRIKRASAIGAHLRAACRQHPGVAHRAGQLTRALYMSVCARSGCCGRWERRARRSAG
jgi:putative ABC transport system permease protein